MTNEEKLKALRNFLNENKIPFINNYHSKTFNVDMAIKVKKLRIAVFISSGDKDFEDRMVFAKSSYNGAPLRNVYNPFFIRKSETKKFVLEKMQNCIVKRMMILQKRWQKKQEND
jgi:hypothetical protein